MRRVNGRSFYKEPWYGSYNSMLQRCENPNAANYDLYGGRGIKVCEEWHDIEVFKKWVKESNYKDGLSIDRIDVNKDYEPSNCRWATAKKQANNRRNTIYVTIDGLTKTISEWAEFSGINRSTLNGRYQNGIRGVMLLHKAEDTTFKDGYNRYENSNHYDDIKTFNENNVAEKYFYNGEEHSLREWSEITGVNEETLRSRRNRGWSIEDMLSKPIMANKFSFKDGTLVNKRQ